MSDATRTLTQVKGLVGIAADPDFTTDVVLPKLDDATKVRVRVCGCASECVSVGV